MLTFTGYFCHSRVKNDDWKYEPYLCKLQPVSEPDKRGDDTLIVPPEGATWKDMIDLDDITEHLVPGKKYRLTIEEVV